MELGVLQCGCAPVEAIVKALIHGSLVVLIIGFSRGPFNRVVQCMPLPYNIKHN